MEEQQKIAEALSDMDNLISSLEKLIEKKKVIKQGAMRELLTGKKRSPGFSGVWKVVHLGNISKIKTGDKNNEQKCDNGAFPFFVRSQQVERINSYSYDGEAILIPGEGNIGQIFHYINGKFDWHQRVYKISDFPDFVSGKYVYYQMKYGFGEHALKYTVKATVDSLRLPTFEKFEFLLPPTKEEQIAIASILSDIDDEIAVLEHKLATCQKLKQGMMQQLLTGKKRLV
jgi:type I restriction enzyme S subunit